MTTSLKFLSWNAQGLKKKLSYLLNYLSKNPTDVICIQEPFIGDPNEKKAPKINGYVPYVLRHKNGLLTYVKESLSHKRISGRVFRNVKYQHIKIKTANDSFSLYNVYAGADSFKINSLPKFSKKGTLCMGDFNARHTSMGDTNINQNGRAFTNFIDSRSLTVYGTTEPTHTAGGRLDYVIGKDLVHDNIHWSLTSLASDHFAIATTYDIDKIHIPKSDRPKITIPPNLTHHFKAQMEHWYQQYHYTNVNKFSEDLVATITAYYNTWVRRKRRKKTQTAQQTGSVPSWTLDPTLLTEQDKVEELGQIYRLNKTQANLDKFLHANSVFRQLIDHTRKDYWEEFLQSINQHTSLAEVWDKINRITKKSTAVPTYHSPQEHANMLLHQWADTSQTCHLPTHVQNILAQNRVNRDFKIEIGKAEVDLTDYYEITERELENALTKGRSTSPGEDGITYDVLRLLAQVPGNPLLHLYRMSLCEGVLPNSWTHSLIIPIPKKDSEKYRPISLTSCLCKVMERIILDRLMYRIRPKLSPKLYGFMPGRSTQHCFAEYLVNTGKHTQTVFIDLKSAFDIANREVILEQLVDFDIKGNLLTWISMYLSNRTATVLHRGVKSNITRTFELGTPQGGVLSPMLFNVLMHRLLSTLQLQRGEEIICYADDICIKAPTPARMQSILNDFATKAAECGLVISVEKTKALRNKQKNVPLPAYHINNNLVDTCRQYRYLGITVNRYLGITVNDPEFIDNLRKRLEERLLPLTTLTRTHGVNFRIAKMFYISFIRSVIDYHALFLLPYLTEKLIKPLEVVQNKAMRTIFDATPCTRTVSMMKELGLPSVRDRVQYICTLFGVKVIRESVYHSTFPQQLHQQLHTQGNEPGTSWLQHMTAAVRQLNINQHLHSLPLSRTIEPWQNRKICVVYPNVPKKDSVHPEAMKQLVLAEAGTLIEQQQGSVFQCYTDGSLQEMGESACACIVYKNDAMQHSDSKRLHDWASTTQTELAGLLLATDFLKQNGSGVIFCDSKPALQALNSTKNVSSLVNDIVANVILAKSQNNYDIIFMWLPSHIGIKRHNDVDELAKTACNNATKEMDGVMPLARIKYLLIEAQRESLQNVMNTERGSSISIRHYDKYSRTPYKYGTHKTLTRQCDIIAARLRLGYRAIWQLQEEQRRANSIERTKCALCGGENMRTLVHYIDQCPVIQPLRPPGKRYQEIINILLTTDLLEDILALYPNFCKLK